MPQAFSSETVSDPLASHRGWKLLDWRTTPESVARRLAHQPGFVWLDSSLPAPKAKSLLTARPSRVLRGNIAYDWDQIDAALQQTTCSRTVTAASPDASWSPSGLYGWVGFDGRFVFGEYKHALLYDHDSGNWFESGDISSFLSSEQRPSPPSTPAFAFAPLISRSAFIEQVTRAQEYIAAGDIYQVNLSVPWQAQWPLGADWMSLYENLRQISPAPHAACLQLDGCTVLSASPELFLKLDGRTITTRPIKGTRPRFAGDSKRDSAAAAELLHSEKERAELLMITDLERNDLGRVCEFGSVVVDALWNVESFAQVHHLVSTVRGTLRSDVSHQAAFQACFPGGSISGAPKKRAVEIIHELEPHPRGLYTGAIGYFGSTGHSQWNIAIRTVVRSGSTCSFHVGSGIVADSVAHLEWEETLHKAAGILQTAGVSSA